MELLQLLEKVREPALTKTALEELYTEFLNLFSATELRLGELEKIEAVYLEHNKDKTLAHAKRTWNSIPEGQELITLKRQSKILEKQLSAIKHRIYSYISY